MVCQMLGTAMVQGINSKIIIKITFHLTLIAYIIRTYYHNTTAPASARLSGSRGHSDQELLTGS